MARVTDITILEIEGMLGAECVARVARALGGLEGVRTLGVEVGAATIDCDNKVTFHEACRAVWSEGFKIRRATAPVGQARVDADAAAAAGVTGDGSPAGSGAGSSA